MKLFGASELTLGMATEYFVIVASFFLFYLVMNVMNSMIRADGSPKYAMIAMLAVTVGVLTGVICRLISGQELTQKGTGCKRKNKRNNTKER